MAAGPWIVFDSFLDEKNAANMDVSTGNAVTYKVALVTQTYVPNLVTHTLFADLTNEITSSGYTAGGQVEVISLDSTVNGEVTIDMVSPDWLAGVGGIVCATAVIYNVDTGKLVAHCQLDNTVPGTPADVTVAEGNSLTVNTNDGIYTESRVAA